MPAPQRPAPKPSAGPAAPRPVTAATTRAQAGAPRPVTAATSKPQAEAPRPVTKTVPRPVTKTVAKVEAPRPAPTFAEDAADLQTASGVISTTPAHGTGSVHRASHHQPDRRVAALGLLAGGLGLGLVVFLVMWAMAAKDASRNSDRLQQANDESSAKRGEMERSTYEAYLNRVRIGCLVLAYAVDQLDASRVAGTLKGGGMGMLKEASEALGAVAHAQTGLTAKIITDLKTAHAKMKELKVSPTQDKAISEVISAGVDVAALQEKALAGLEENQIEGFSNSIAKVRADFTKAYRELAEIARF